MSETFVETNARVHLELEDRFLEFICVLTELRIDDAAVKLEYLFALMDAHIEVEDGRILPCLTSLLAPDENDAKAVALAKNTVQLIDGDHTILLRSQKAMREQLAAFDATTTRREMVQSLDTFLRFGRVLDHHTTREERTLYPVLDLHRGSALDDESANSLLTALSAALA